MSKINLDQLDSTIQKELGLYHKSITDAIKVKTKASMKELVKETKAHRYKEDTGAYRKAISSQKLEETLSSITEQWYVEAPHNRLTHLLEYGHAKRGGGRTIAYGNIGKSSDRIIEQYEKDVMEVIENGG